MKGGLPEVCFRYFGYVVVVLKLNLRARFRVSEVYGMSLVWGRGFALWYFVLIL